MHRDPQLLKPVRHRRAFQIRPRHAKAQVAQDLCDAGHADAADADQMDVAYAMEHKLKKSEVGSQQPEVLSSRCYLLASGFRLLASTNLSIRSTVVAAASRRANLRAACAIASS